VPHAGQFQKNRQASLGIVSTLDFPHCGQVSVLFRVIAA
jgi:hypothetical protein